MNKYLLGVDVGSSAAKATLISTQGEVVGTATLEYKTNYPQISWAEQEPEDWYHAVRVILSQIADKTGVNSKDILALALDGATHTAVLMDEEYNVLRPAIMWTDQRSSDQSKWLRYELGDKILSLSYNTPSPMWTLPQMLWVKENQPQIWKQVRRILFAKDYVRYRLTGEYATDWIEALGSMFLDAGTKEWSPQLCAIMGFLPEDLPRIVAPTDILGKVSAIAARETGLSEGTLVVAGASDTALEIFAAGAVSVGQATIKLATSGRICIISEKPYLNPLLVNYYHLIPGKWYPGTGTRSCASSFKWFRDTFATYENEIAEQNNENVYAVLDEAAGSIPIGSEGLFYHPYLIGELTPYLDPFLKGSFTGISMRHTKAHFARSVLEGVAYSLYDCMEVMKSLGTDIHEFRIIGGGAKSPLWRQIAADVLGVQVLKPVVDDSSFGSALLAGVGIGVYSGFEAAVNQCVRIETTITPNDKNHKKYEKLFAIYREIHDGLAPIYPKIKKIIEE